MIRYIPRVRDCARSPISNVMDAVDKIKVIGARGINIDLDGRRLIRVLDKAKDIPNCGFLGSRSFRSLEGNNIVSTWRRSQYLSRCVKFNSRGVSEKNLC